MSGVWIVDMDNTKERTVKEAMWYQKDGYDQFMADHEKKTLKYNDGTYVFTIHPFYGNSSFCIYINESGVGRVLSNNEEALKGYVNATNKKAANQNVSRQNASRQNAANKNAANKNASRQNAARQNAARQNAPLSPAGDVWIARMDGTVDVTKADPNQADAYHKFMSRSDPKLYDVTYYYPDSTTIKISTFEVVQKRTRRFCNIMVSGKAVYILSDDQKALESYISTGRKVVGSDG